MPALFSALAAIYTSAAKCAAALGMSRQAYCQAAKRRRLSDSATIRAAALLKINPGKALLANATGKDIAPPKRHPTPDPRPQILDAKKPTNCRQKNEHEITPDYKLCAVHVSEKIGKMPAMQKLVHVIPQSTKRLYEIDCVKWMLCVPRISPDSPRFAHYFSRWAVPEKIAASKARGDFDELTKNCLFAPELVRYIQAGIDEYHRFIADTRKTRLFSTSEPPPVQLNLSIAL